VKRGQAFEQRPLQKRTIIEPIKTYGAPEYLLTRLEMELSLCYICASQNVVEALAGEPSDSGEIPTQVLARRLRKHEDGRGTQGLELPLKVKGLILGASLVSPRAVLKDECVNRWGGSALTE
jgi:hypothetical protein